MLQYNENEKHIVCPWHGWEFSLKTGTPSRQREAHALRKAKLEIIDGMSMSSSEPALPNDPYAWIDRYAADLHQAARTLARDGEAARVSDEAVAQLLTAAIRLYVAKADGEERTFSPIIREDDRSDDGDRGAVRRVGAAARAAARPDGAGALVPSPARRGLICRLHR